jgi:aspartate dehydrogenase
LALAGAGLDTTQVEIWADPTICRNSHTIHIESDAASFSMTIDNILSDNPRTSKIAALSAISCLRKLRAALRVGS